MTINIECSFVRVRTDPEAPNTTLEFLEPNQLLKNLLNVFENDYGPKSERVF
jgi:hypothetical protein